MAPAVVSGERLVVFLFVARVALAAPAVRLAAPLAVLAAAALAVDGSASAAVASSSSQLRRFRTRPGASSGILLGATTLPSVMLSRLIQLSRVLKADPNGHEEYAYVEMQYWAVSISCLSMLAFFVWHLRQSPNNGISNASKYGLVLIILYPLAYLFFFLLKTDGGTCIFYLHAKMITPLLFKTWWELMRRKELQTNLGFVLIGLPAMSNLAYLLCHGVAAVILIQHILEKFPSCSSFGEATLVSSGLVLYCGDMLAHTLSKVMEFSMSSEAFIRTPGTQSKIGTIIQGLLLGLFLLPLLYKSSLQVLAYCRKLERQRTQTVEEYTQKRIDCVPSWTRLVQGFEVHPFVWVFNYIFTDSRARLVLCAYWIFVIYVSIRRFYSISKQSKTERILLRKYYHLVAVLIFSPAVIFQPDFLDLAFGAAFAVFLILEMIRVWEIYPLGHIVHQFMNAFTDHRDSEILIVSHFSLLLGCALPKWMSSGFNDRPLTPFAGILSLGIGDTMASMIGYKYGVLRWSKTGKKTIEGTAAGITSVLAACSILLSLLASSGYILSQHWLSLLVAVTLSGLLEAYTAQLDNAFIPLVFYSLLCL
uniref:dolichol kinase n=1 Tax=Leersia perrieri TaxID=77586 RepID=A0A0D9VC65_9ORYZ